jgi:hypothetical protein
MNQPAFEHSEISFVTFSLADRIFATRTKASERMKVLVTGSSGHLGEVSKNSEKCRTLVKSFA